MHTLAELEALAEEGTERLATVVLSADSALEALPAMTLAAADAARLAQGQLVELAAGGALGLVRVYAPDGFLGVAERMPEGRLRAKRLLGTGNA
jgi:tRNA pseudouridine55 synthase